MLYSEESFGNLALARGGKNGYERVRGGQGTRHDKWQGYTKGKKKTTELYDTAEEAAVALARLEQDLTLGLIEFEDKNRARSARPRVRPRPPAPPARPPACPSTAYIRAPTALRRRGRAVRVAGDDGALPGRAQSGPGIAPIAAARAQAGRPRDAGHARPVGRAGRRVARGVPGPAPPARNDAAAHRVSIPYHPVAFATTHVCASRGPPRTASAGCICVSGLHPLG